MEACPRRAIEKRAGDGIVLIDQTRCKGYRFCMEACPYKKIYFNEIQKVSQKCIFCFPRSKKASRRPARANARAAFATWVILMTRKGRFTSS